MKVEEEAGSGDTFRPNVRSFNCAFSIIVTTKIACSSRGANSLTVAASNFIVLSRATRSDLVAGGIWSTAGEGTAFRSGNSFSVTEATTLAEGAMGLDDTTVVEVAVGFGGTAATLSEPRRFGGMDLFLVRRNLYFPESL